MNSAFLTPFILSIGALSSHAGSKSTPIEYSPAEDSWSFSIAPYLWLSSIDGQVGVPNLPVADVDAKFKDIWDNLDFAGFMAIRAEKGKFRSFADIQYVNLGADASLPNSGSARLDVEQFRFELGLGYVVFENDSTSLHPYAGVMYNYIQDSLSLTNIRKLEASKGWIDPVIGLTFAHSFSDKWQTRLTGEYGGFGISSESTWQGLATVAYRFHTDWNALIGYRHQSIDFKEDDFVYNTNTSGPFLGVSYTF